MTKNITLVQAQEMQAGGALFLDGRSAEEYQAGHIAGSISLPVERLADQIAGVTGMAGRGRSLLLYCSTGSRSRLAAQVLQRLGYQKLYIIM